MPQRAIVIFCWLIVAAAFVVGAVSGVRRGLQGRPDWRDFRDESRYVWEHGCTRPGTAMFGYLPTATFVLWPFTVALPPTVGVVAWVALNTIAGGLALWLVHRFWLAGTPGAVLAVPAALAAANLAHGILSNQMTMLTLVLCVAGLGLVHHRRGFWGGLLLGVAVLIKTLPALLVPYLVITRRGRALVGVVAAAVLFDLLPSVMFFGPAGAMAEHRAFLERAGWHSNRLLIEQPFLRVHRHGTNASYAAVLARWLREPPSATRQVILYGQPPADVIARYRTELKPDEMLVLDPMPPDEGIWSERRIDDLSWVPRFHLADLPANVVYGIWLASLGVGGLALAVATWRAGRRPDFDWPPVAAMWLLAMYWPSPMMRHYYLAWALPALAVVGATLWQRRAAGGAGGNRTGGEVLASITWAAWLIGAFCLGAPVPRWYGLHLAAIMLLMGAVAWCWMTRSRVRSPG